MFKKVAIIGVGLIGGSIGKALRKRGLAEEVVGIGRREVSLEKAKKAGAVDSTTLDIDKGIKDADLVIVAVNVDKVKEKIKQASVNMKKGSILMDVNSTKGEIISFANKCIKKGVFFIGAHPMAGKEKTGVNASDEKLFNGTVCILTPDKKTDKLALNRIESLWSNLGARVLLLSANEHDKIVARVSHLPHLLAYALCNTVTEQEMSFSGSGFKDSTRIAKSDIDMWTEIFLQNRQELLKAVKSFESFFSKLKLNLEKGNRALIKKQLLKAKEKRDVVR
ncbi:MAG: prephenate dehydrogenase [Candidatus Omnitrophota bacterium]